MIGSIAVYTKLWRSGGAGLFAQKLVGGLLTTGVRVIFVAPEPELALPEAPNDRLRQYQPPRQKDAGGRLSRAAVSIARIAGSAAALARARLSTATFIVSIPDPFIVSLPMLAMLRLSGARIIYVVHDPLPHAWRFKGWLRGVENFGFRAMYALSNALVVLSQAGRDALIAAYGIDPRRVTVIEHGSFGLATAAPRPAPGAGEMLLFGTLRRNKGVWDAIQGVLIARARGAKVRLHIAGAPDPVDAGYWGECETLARDHDDAVSLEIGYVSDARLSELIGACDAFLLPYRDFASQSGVAILASSNQRTILASCAGGIAELMESGAVSVPIADPVDGPAVADALCAFAATPITAWNDRTAAAHTANEAARAWPVIGERYVALAGQLVQAGQ